MGFGTLFIGYFLLLNVTYFEYTDLLCGLIMLLGLYKLSSINKPFKIAFFATAAFSVLGAAELILALVSFFVPSLSESSLFIALGAVRYIAAGVLTVIILTGIKTVADEVGLAKLKKSANLRMYLSSALFLLTALFSIPAPDGIAGGMLKVITITAFICLFSLFIIIIANLVTVYTAYMKICMPEDKNGGEVKKSKFGFINKFREHEEEKQREYAEYRLSKINKNKKKRKK